MKICVHVILIVVPVNKNMKKDSKMLNAVNCIRKYTAQKCDISISPFDIMFNSDVFTAVDILCTKMKSNVSMLIKRKGDGQIVNRISIHFN